MRWKVRHFYRLMLGNTPEIEKANKVKVYSDTWGIRKLITHVLRNLRTDRVPRVACSKNWETIDYR